MIGYNPETTKSDKVPIVTALIKAKSSSTGNHPILLKIHETPYNSHSPITLLSEYQIREYGLVIDSVATKHMSTHGRKGTQRFELNKWVYINFEDRGGLMGFEILPIEEGDEEKYDIFTITSPERWYPHKFQSLSYHTSLSHENSDDPKFESEDQTQTPSSSLGPQNSTSSLLNSMTYEELTGQHHLDYDFMDNPSFFNEPNEDASNLSLKTIKSEINVLSPNMPIMDTHVYATKAWHRIIHKEIDPRKLRPYLGWKPLHVVKKTLERTTQMAKMSIRHPLRQHVKSRLPHMNVTRLDETFSTDPFFANVKSIHHGYVGAQVFYGTKSHTIFIYGFRKKGEFPKLYRDFIREHGAPSTLRRDNAREEQSEEVLEINREMLIKDKFTEPYNPQQNPVESSAIRYIKEQVLKVLDITGAPESTWFFAAQYVSDIHNICSDDSLPDEMTPLQYLEGSTPDISAYLQFTFWQPVLFLDHEALWPSTNERSGRWLGVAHNVGDALTFWILDDQSKQVFAQSVVRPLNHNLRVKWDPALAPNPSKHTAQNGGDQMPSKSLKEKLLASAMDQYDQLEPEPVENPKAKVIKNSNMAKSSLKNTYVNPGMDTSKLFVPKDQQKLLNSTKLILDNDPVLLDDTIPTFNRTGKKAYNEIKYNQEYHPPDFTSPNAQRKHVSFKIDKGEHNQLPRRSERLKNKTKWKPTKVAQTICTALLVSNCVYAEPAKPLQKFEFSTPYKKLKTSPLSERDKEEQLRAYHARIDLMNDMFNGDTHDWEVEHIDKHLVKKKDDQINIYFKVVWFGGHKQWVHMDDLRQHDPFMLIRYALRNHLLNQQGWEWTKHYIDADTELAKMVKAYNVSKESVNIKFGVEVPVNTKAAILLDQKNGDNKWKEAMKTEIDSINAYQTFRVLQDKEPLPPGYKYIPYHCIYDVKFDGRRKCRLVAGGHKTETPKEDIFSGVIGMEAVRLGFILANLNGLLICAGDIGNAFLYGKTREKVYIIAGPEFGPDLQGKRMIIEKSLYGLKSSAARFHEHLSVTLRSLGYKPSKADFDLWYKKVDDHYEYIARYVDDVIVFSKDPMSIMEKLQKIYVMKGIGKPQYYLGGDIIEMPPEWNKENISLAFSAETYITNLLPKLAETCGFQQFHKYKIPFSEDYHPELDNSDLLDAKNITLYKSLLGSANWIITLGRFDIAYAVNTLSRYSMAPREGHLKALQKVFGYLRNRPNGKILIDSKVPKIRETAVITRGQDWNEFYPDAMENIPDDMLEPKGKLCTLTCYVDADHARDQLTRRSVTGIILLLNNTPIIWISKRQKTVETSTYGSELVASRIAIELIISMRYCLRMLGVKLEDSSLLVGDNMAVILNTTIPSSALKKKHQACNYHKIRESIAAGFINYGHIPSSDNLADITTKPLGRIAFERLTSQYLFRRINFEDAQDEK